MYVSVMMMKHDIVDKRCFLGGIMSRRINGMNYLNNYQDLYCFPTVLNLLRLNRNVTDKTTTLCHVKVLNYPTLRNVISYFTRLGQ